MTLRYYETFYLLHPDLSEEERTAISEKLQQIITEKGGQIVEVKPWPLHKLAYRVQKQTQGYYVVMEYGATADTISDLTVSMRLNDRLLKFITIKKADRFDAKVFADAKEDSAPPVEAAEETTDSTQDAEIKVEE